MSLTEFKNLSPLAFRIGTLRAIRRASQFLASRDGALTDPRNSGRSARAFLNSSISSGPTGRRPREHRAASNSRKDPSMYIGLGTVVLILLVILLFWMFSSRRA